MSANVNDYIKNIAITEVRAQSQGAKIFLKTKYFQQFSFNPYKTIYNFKTLSVMSGNVNIIKTAKSAQLQGAKFFIRTKYF